MEWKRYGAVALVGLLWACGDNGDEDDNSTDDVGDVTDAGGDTAPDVVDDTGEDAQQDVAPDAVDDAGADTADATDTADGDTGGTDTPLCDPLDPAACTLPWPSNLYLVEDASRVTGHEIRFGDTSLPSNRQNVHIDPALYRRYDGYPIGSNILVYFAGIDLTGWATETDLAPSLAEDAPALLFAVTDEGLVRVPYWAELDLDVSGPQEQSLSLRPGVLLDPATRYIVAFRDLVDTGGDPIAASEAFAALRDETATEIATVEARRAHFEEIFDLLEAEGVERESLTLAWDFWTASHEALHGRMLDILEQAWEAVGEGGPELTVTSVTEYVQEDDGAGTPVDPHIQYRISGTFRAPHFMREVQVNTTTGWYINEDEAGVITQNGWRDARFELMVPFDTDPEAPFELVQYGHGLLGSSNQVYSGHNRQVAYDHQLIYFGADLVGMSEQDVAGNVLASSNPTYFQMTGDRLHQGMMEYVLLARGVRERLTEVPEVAALELDVATDAVYWSGISQGGIFGATFVALSPDVSRGHLGVPGANYSLLLQRSVDFEAYLGIIKISFPSAIDRMVLLQLLQFQWEHTEPSSYYRHLSLDPLPGHETNQVLLAPAKGDYQVAVLSLEVIARSDLGVALMANYGRDVSLVEPTAYPHTGSGIVLYDHGNPWPAPGNLPPEDDLGDPHGLPRRLAWHNEQMVHFFRTGEIIDVCGGDGCTPD